MIIESGDAFKVIAKHDHQDGVIYLDPPYHKDVRKDATGGYRYEATSDEFHARLAEAANACEAHVLVSGYRCDIYDEIYAGWESVDMAVTSSAGRSTENRETSRVETVWSNRPLVTA